MDELVMLMINSFKRLESEMLKSNFFIDGNIFSSSTSKHYCFKTRGRAEEERGRYKGMHQRDVLKLLAREMERCTCAERNYSRKWTFHLNPPPPHIPNNQFKTIAFE